LRQSLEEAAAAKQLVIPAKAGPDSQVTLPFTLDPRFRGDDSDDDSDKTQPSLAKMQAIDLGPRSLNFRGRDVGALALAFLR
jgi:hypothetical protein